MTTFGREPKMCAVCGDHVDVKVLTSSNEMGPRDLDCRPAEMLRSTMGTWVQECPGCGYCSGDVSEALSHAGALVRSDHYQALREVGPFPPLAAQFLRHGLLFQATGDYAGAFHCAMRAA